MSIRSIAFLAVLAACADSTDVAAPNRPELGVRAAASGWTIRRLPIAAIAGCTGIATAVAYDINSAGIIVGTAQCSGPTHRFVPVIWTSAGTMMQELPLPTGVTSAVATSINNFNQVGGWDYSGTTGLFWEKTTAPALQIGNLGQPGIVVLGINDPGVLTGYGRPTGSSHEETFTWSLAAGFTVLPPLGTWGQGNAIDYNGDVVGESDGFSGRSAATCWCGGGPVDFGTMFTGTWAKAVGISADGHYVTGTGDFHGGEWPFVIVNGGRPKAVGLPAGATFGHGNDVNRRGQLVGDFRSAVTFHAFLIEPGAPSLDLGVLPGTSSSFAYAINECGQVVGEVRDSLGNVPVTWDHLCG